jgi:hypothetical protein
MLGGFVALFQKSSSAARAADNLASGRAYGAFLGTVFGMALWIFEAPIGGAACPRGR